jgi:hypothetical protein
VDERVLTKNLLHRVKWTVHRKTCVCVFDGMGDRCSIKQDLKRINTGLCDMRLVESVVLIS